MSKNKSKKIKAISYFKSPKLKIKKEKPKHLGVEPYT